MSMEITAKAVTVQVKIGEHVHEMEAAEARKLYEQLRDLFSSQQGPLQQFVTGLSIAPQAPRLDPHHPYGPGMLPRPGYLS